MNMSQTANMRRLRRPVRQRCLPGDGAFEPGGAPKSAFAALPIPCTITDISAAGARISDLPDVHSGDGRVPPCR